MRGEFAALAALACLIAPARGAEPFDTPVYDPGSKSYFALIDGRTHKAQYHTGFEWIEAYEDAKTREYKGGRGRLAIISTPEIHSFLLRTFEPKAPAWIGFRYDCAAKQLKDSMGRTAASGFAAWDGAGWNKDPTVVCIINPYTHTLEPPAYAGIAYSPVSRGFRWIGLGPRKGYDYYFIEFPTGNR